MPLPEPIARTTTEPPLAKRLAGYAVHLYTASGIVFAALAMLEVCSADPDVQRVFLWLAIAVLVDATDGPMARAVDIKHSAPAINGRTIDDIVDFLTFTFIPLLLIARMQWVPQPVLLYVAPPLMASLLGFANVAAKIEEHGFFLGFPSYWNIVAFYFAIFTPTYGTTVNGIALLLLAVLTVTPVGFIYPNLAPRRWKPLILIGAAVWGLLLAAMIAMFPDVPKWLVLASLVYPLVYVAVSLFEFNRYRVTRGAK